MAAIFTEVWAESRLANGCLTEGGSYMKNIFVLLFGFFVFTVGAEDSINSEMAPDWTGYALISASPRIVRSAVDDSGGSDVELPYAGEFYVRLKKIEVIYGSFDKKTVDVKLTASHREAISSKRRIYVLLKISGGVVSSVSWGVPSRIVCFPREMISDKKIAGDFIFTDAGNGRLCTNAEWYK